MLDLVSLVAKNAESRANFELSPNDVRDTAGTSPFKGGCHSYVLTIGVFFGLLKGFSLQF